MGCARPKTRVRLPAAAGAVFGFGACVVLHECSPHSVCELEREIKVKIPVHRCWACMQQPHINKHLMAAVYIISLTLFLPAKKRFTPQRRHGGGWLGVRMVVVSLEKCCVRVRNSSGLALRSAAQCKYPRTATTHSASANNATAEYDLVTSLARLSPGCSLSLHEDAQRRRVKHVFHKCAHTHSLPWSCAAKHQRQKATAAASER